MAQNEVIDRPGFIEWGRTQLLAKPWVVALIYLVALIVAEALTTLISPRAGMILHGLILIALLLQAALSIRRREYRFLVALALAPLIRLLSLALPLTNFPFIFWYAVVGVPLFIATFMSARVTGLKPNMIGLRFSWRALPMQLLIGLSGLAIGYIEYLILRPDPLVAELRWELIWMPALILLLFTGFLEELIFRGLMQTSSTQELGRLGIVFVAVVFAVLHLGYRSVLDVIFVFAVALIFGLLVQRFSSLLGVSISHGLTNISLYLIFPFLVAAPLVSRSAPQEVLTAPEEVQSAPADLFSPKVITPYFSGLITPTPFQPVANTPTSTATLPPTETATSTASPMPPTPTPTPIPTQTLTQPPVIWPTLVPLPTPTLIIPTELPTAEFPTQTLTPLPPSETPATVLPTDTTTPLPPSATATDIPTLQPSATSYPTEWPIPSLQPSATSYPTEWPILTPTSAPTQAPTIPTAPTPTNVH